MTEHIYFVMSLHGVTRCTSATAALEARAEHAERVGARFVTILPVCPAHPSAGWLR